MSGASRSPAHYFPVGSTYRLPGTEYALGEPGAGELRFEVDATHARYVAAKRAAAGQWESAGLQAQLEPLVTHWLDAAIRKDQPQLPPAAGGPGELLARMQEDLVVMHRPPGAAAVRARAVYVNVSFASGWCPACAVGMPFLRIHAPVPNADAFGGAGRLAAAESLFAGRTFVRFVWTLIPDDQLDRRLCRKTGPSAHASTTPSWNAPDRLYLRVERQIVDPIDAASSAFVIRVYHYELASLAESQRHAIRTALASMPDTVRRYKNLPIGLADWI